MQYSFDNLGLHAVRAETVTLQVKEIFIEFGFTPIGSTLGTTYHNGEWWADHILELYDKVWFRKRDGIYEGSVKPHFEKADITIQDTIR